MSIDDEVAPQIKQTVEAYEQPKPSESELSDLLCVDCNGTGAILQSDGSDSTGTIIDCELCNDHLLLFHECPSCNNRCNCGSSPCECDCSKVN